MRMNAAQWAVVMVAAIAAPACASSARVPANAPAARHAEEAACVGVPAEMRDGNPLTGMRDARVTPLRDAVTEYGPRDQPFLRGAEIVVAAQPGLTAEWTQRMLDCKVAHEAALGSGAEPASPLAVAGVRAEVRSVGDGFAIDLVTHDWRASEEVIRRANALASR